MASVFHLLFAPHPHNNHKPKILWSQSILVLLGLFIFGSSLIDVLSGLKPGILGYASQIDPTKVIEYTNQERAANGLPALNTDRQLTEAAHAKAIDMFQNNYWAHVSPTGVEPWSFILKAGYDYSHAGENLARDFTNPRSVVDAWMASPSHKRNILDDRYKDIGVAVMDGYINGVETTLVVQMFGVKQVVAEKPQVTSTSVVQPVLASTDQTKLYPQTGISPFTAKKSWSFAFIIIIVVALSFDWFFVWKNNIIRISGKTWAHLTYFLCLAAILFIIRQGLVL